MGNKIWYFIQSGKRYIYRDKCGAYTLTTNFSQAEKSDDYHKMKNIMDNCLSATLKKKCNISTSSTYNNATNAPTPVTETVEVVEETYDDIDYNEILHKASECILYLAEFVNIKDKFPDYNKMQNDYQSELTDIEHYIEMANLNACEGFKAFKLFQDKRKERRDVKTKGILFYQINQFLEGKTDIESAAISINGLLHPTYTPRKLNDLFENILNEDGTLK